MTKSLSFAGLGVALLTWSFTFVVIGADDSECGLYLAPSLTSGNDDPKWGLFAGVPIPPNSPVGSPEIAIHTHNMLGNAKTEEDSSNVLVDTVSFLEEYIWVSDSTGGARELGEGRNVAVIPGIGILGAYGKKLSNADWDIRGAYYKDVVGEDGTKGVPHVGRGASSHFYNITVQSTGLITAGSEIYINYGEAWGEDKDEDENENKLEEADFEKADQFIEQMINFFDKYKDELTEAAKYEIYEFLLGDILQAAAGAEKGKTIRGLLPKNPDELVDVRDAGGAQQYSAPSPSRSLSWLKANGRCMDHLFMGSSTIPYAGRGAFARRRIQAGGLVSPAPLIQIPKKDVMNMHEVHKASVSRKKKPIFYRTNDEVIGKQLLLNYCFGHPESSMLFFPSGSLTSLINHSAERPNVKMQFSNHERHNKDWYNVAPEQLIDDKHYKLGLMMDVVALRDIEEGEEILMDYGPEWQAAWVAHVERWNSGIAAGEINNTWPIRALDLSQEYKTKAFPTLSEGASFPDNVRQMCFLVLKEVTIDDRPVKSWTSPRVGTVFDNDHLFDCKVIERIELDEALPISNMPYNYTIEWFNGFDTSGTGKRVVKVPHSMIVFVDMPRTSDQFVPQAFRHEIGIPDDVFPRGPWRNLVSPAAEVE